ncbi:MAG TPA: hypothetical protein VHH36_08255 [Candidatus Thermoplasmatota archaeon]|nr:hypothetical protein [Candidatus Thermoplasmatota archaeon]
MRPLLALLLATALLPAFPASAAAEEGGALLTDPAGDVEGYAYTWFTPGADAPVPEGAAGSDAVDLLALSAVETDGDLMLTIHVKSLAGQDVSAGHSASFAWGDTDYWINGWYQRSALFGESMSASMSMSRGDDFSWLGRIPATVDADAGTITFTVSKLLVTDGDGRTPHRGATIGELGAYTYRDPADAPLFFVPGGVGFHDSMGDDSAKYAFLKGDDVTGPLVVGCVDRIRVSNGGATTLVYRVTIKNTGERPQDLDLALVDLPQGWNASVESPLRMGPGESRTLPVLASVPFAHVHGGFSGFNLTVQDRNDANTRGRMMLGVLHTPIAQPAGHHPDLYLHVPQGTGAGPVVDEFQRQFPFGALRMNTESTHEAELPEVYPTWNDGGAYAWWMRLEPALRMGLDFDVTKTGLVEGAVRGVVDTPATVTAILHYASADTTGDWNETILAESDAVSVDLKRDAATPFALTLTPTADADYVPYMPRQRLSLELRVEPEVQTPNVEILFLLEAAQPRLEVETFHVSLPLEEYHDRLSSVGGDSLVSLQAVGEVQRAARPGTTIAYLFDLKNGAGEDVVFDVNVAGGDAALGQIVPAQGVVVPGGGTVRLTLGVTVPSDAEDGRQIEVLVFAHARDDPALSAIARTSTVVTSGADAAPDESDVLRQAQDAQRDAPGPALALVVLIAVGVAVARARK